MNNKVKIILLFLIVFVNLHCFHTQKKRDACNTNRTNDIEIRTFWVNCEYLECVKKTSLDKCRKAIINNVLILDSLKHANIKCFNEYCSYDIIRENGKYCFYTFDSIRNELEIINNDTVLLNGTRFISNKDWESSGGYYVLGKINGDIFKEKYKAQLSSIFNSLDTILIDYNPFWQIYFLRNKKSCDDMYIMEYKQDTIFVYDFTEKCKPLTPKRKENVELILQFPEVAF